MGTRYLALMLLTSLLLSGCCRNNRSLVGRTPPPPPGRPRTIPPTPIPDLPPTPAPEFREGGGNAPRYTPPRAELLLPEPLPPEPIPPANKSDSNYPPRWNGNESRAFPPQTRSGSGSGSGPSTGSGSGPSTGSGNGSGSGSGLGSSPVDGLAQSPSRLPELPPSPSAKNRPSEFRTEPVTPTPLVKNENPASQANRPVGIENFTRLDEGLYVSRRPDLEGLDWLQQQKFATVIYLRQSQDDDTSDQRQAEKRGLQYSSYIIAAETINLAIIKEISNTLADPKQRPLLIYDREGSLVGTVWYLHLRTVDGLNHDEALTKARPLGLNPEGTPQQRSLAQAAKELFNP